MCRVTEVRHGRTFQQWKREAETICAELSGVGLDDLPDKPYWDYWSSGYSPDDTAREVLEEEGFEVES